MKPHYRVIPKGTPFLLQALNYTEITLTEDCLVRFYFRVEDEGELTQGTLQNTWMGGAVDKENGEIVIDYNKTIELED